MFDLQLPLFPSFQPRSDNPRGPMLSDLGCPHLLLKLADHTGKLQNWHPRRPFLHHVGFQPPPGAPSIFNYFSPFFEAFLAHAVYAVSKGTEQPSPHRLFAVLSQAGSSFLCVSEGHLRAWRQIQAGCISTMVKSRGFRTHGETETLTPAVGAVPALPSLHSHYQAPGKHPIFPGAGKDANVRYVMTS